MIDRPLTFPTRKVRMFRRYGGFVGVGGPDDGSEAGHAAIDELDPPRPQLDVVDRTVEVPVGVRL
jgi:hypothetical protein